ncbi:MAG TPA: NAD(P)/FAD-dependent oxidoreductase [Gammaproteobacteria bacterium]|nr:NAD(P)/FAD-dependent oxidoreductase [Gammaproteobacteria bacterium]
MRLRTDVLIVGAGPAGLLLGCLLIRRGIGCRVLEQRAAVGDHSRSIGIHPVALEIFSRLGIVREFIAEGCRIEFGRAFVNRECVGSLPFAQCPPPFCFILSLPQSRTEALLERHLRSLDASVLVRDAEVTAVESANGDVAVTYCHAGEQAASTANYVIGCDGMHSIVRRAAGIVFDGGTYADAYVMGDFEDRDGNTDACVYLHQDGLVESFPLPGYRRRWVVKTDTLLPECRREDIVGRVWDRLGIDLEGGECFMPSAFGVQHYLAETFVKGRTLLAGDAAHVISPIGGQGMNLGWLDAWRLAEALAKRRESASDAALIDYGRTRRTMAEKARRRAEFNMRLGCRFARPRLRKALVKTMLAQPLAGHMARMFTMRGL